MWVVLRQNCEFKTSPHGFQHQNPTLQKGDGATIESHLAKKCGKCKTLKQYQEKVFEYIYWYVVCTQEKILSTSMM